MTSAAAPLIDHAGAAPASLAAQMTWWSPGDAAQFGVGALGLALAASALPQVVTAVRSALQPLPAPTRRWLLLALLLAGLLRLLAPQHLTMLFSGYELTERSATLLAVHRYGAGSQVLQRLLFTVLPPDHATLVAAHRLAAWLALWPLLALFARWRPPPSALVLAAFGLATLPLLVRDAASESILTVGQLWLWSGLLLLETGQPLRAALLLAAAALTRPELALVAPLLALLVLQRGDRSRRPFVWWLWLPFGLLAAPQFVHTAERLASDAAAGTNRLERLVPLGPLAAIGSSVVLWPLAFPLAWTVLALWGARTGQAQRTQRVWRLRWLLATYVWTILLLVDLPRTSVPRLEAPIAAIWLLFAAWTWAELGQKAQRWALAGIVLTTLPTLSLFAPTNEDDAERFTQAALQRLPAHGACLVTLHESDPPDKGKVQRAFPDYLLRPPHRAVARFAMAAWQQAGAPRCGAGTFLLIEHRCYAIFHHPVQAPPLLPICAETLARHPWQPVLEEQAPNRGQNEYGWYPESATLALGLYRLQQ